MYIEQIVYLFLLFPFADPPKAFITPYPQLSSQEKGKKKKNASEDYNCNINEISFR